MVKKSKPSPADPADRTRDAFARLPAGPEKTELLQAMIARVWTLLDSNRLAEADAILEFVPAKVCIRLLDMFFDEEAPHPPQASSPEIADAMWQQVSPKAPEENRPHRIDPVEADSWQPGKGELQPSEPAGPGLDDVTSPTPASNVER